MKNHVVTVEIELGWPDKRSAKDRVLQIPFGDYDCGFRIVKIREGTIPEEDDETLKPTYREIHGCDR